MLRRLDSVTTTASRMLARVNRVRGGREKVGTVRKDYLTTLPFHCPITWGWSWIGFEGFSTFVFSRIEIDCFTIVCMGLNDFVTNIC